MKKIIVTITFILGYLCCLGDEFEDYMHKEIEYLNNLLLWCDNDSVDFERDLMQVRYVKGRLYEAESILKFYQEYRNSID